MVDTSTLEGIAAASAPKPQAPKPATAPRATPPSTAPVTAVVEPEDPDHSIDVDEEANIRAEYPTMAHWLDHSELGPILRQAVKEGWDDSKLQAAVEGSDWFQTTEASEREYASREARDPASLKRDVDQQAYMLDNIARSQGITMSKDEVQALAVDVIKFGQSEDEILRIIADRARAQVTGGGQLSDGMAAIKQSLGQMASAYYLRLDDSTLNEYAARIYEGTWSKDAAKATFQSQAQQFFPHLKQQLTDGMTVEDYFAPVKARVASILEMNATDIDLRNPKWAGLTQMVDDNGTLRTPTYTEIDQFARNTDEFGYTKEAIDDGYRMASGFLRKMGVMR